jgi:transcriptional regulator
MHLPKHFEETRVPVLHGLIRTHPLGALVMRGPDGLDANHIPFEIDPEPGPFGTLRGHIARANPLWRERSPDPAALVIFQGPDTYVSPSWYPTKTETGKVVPTRNYAVVHAHGTVRFIDDRTWLRAFVEKLTHRHESPRRQPWKITDAPSDYIESQLGAIIGVEIPIARLVGKWKVSQNRSTADREGAAQGLSREGGLPGDAMARLIRQARNDPSG